MQERTHDGMALKDATYGVRGKNEQETLSDVNQQNSYVGALSS